MACWLEKVKVTKHVSSVVTVLGKPVDYTLQRVKKCGFRSQLVSVGPFALS